MKQQMIIKSSQPYGDGGEELDWKIAISARQGRQDGLTGKGLRSRCEEVERRTGARKPYLSQRAMFAVPATDEKVQE